MTDLLELMRWQAAALYTFDTRGRLTGINEAGSGDPTPRFFMGRTPAGNVWHLGANLPAELAAELGALCRREPPLTPGQNAEPVLAGAVRELLSPMQAEYRGPAYWLPTPQPVPASAVQIVAANLELLRPHFPAFLERSLAREAPVAVSVVDGVAVALCSCARLTGAVAEAGVRTAPEYRGLGHATAAVACWARLVVAAGRLPLYSTSWDNLASQRVATRLGAVQYGEDWSIV